MNLFLNKYQRQFQLVSLVVTVSSLLLLIIWLSPSLQVFLRATLDFSLLHRFMENFIVILAMLIFAIGWNAYHKKLPGNVIVLSCMFLGVGLLDFAHMLSEPEELENNLQIIVNFWLAARLLAAIALLIIALLPWRPLAKNGSRYLLLSGILMLTSFLYGLCWFYDDLFVSNFFFEEHLTFFKMGLEYVIIILGVITIIIFYTKMQHAQPYDVVNLLAATTMMLLSQLAFLPYDKEAYLFNLLGQIYQIIAYLFLYQAIFAIAIRFPYQKLYESKKQLQQAQQALHESETRYRTICEITSDYAYAFQVLPDGTFVQEWVTEAFYRLTGFTNEELNELGGATNLIHPDDISFVLERRNILLSGQSDVSEFRIVTKTGQVRWLLNYGRPQWDKAQNRIVRVIGAAQDITSRHREEERLAKLNQCVTHFGADSQENINNLVALCGELMEADYVLYNRLGQGLVHSWGTWQTSLNSDATTPFICHDAISFGEKEILIVNNLSNTPHVETDPNIERYQLQTYLGQIVKCGTNPVGLLCVLYKKDININEQDKRLISIIVAAIGVEEERWQAEQAVKAERTFLQNIIDGLPDPIMVVRDDCEIILMNRMARKWVTTINDKTEELFCHQIDYGSVTANQPCPLQLVRQQKQPVLVVHERFNQQGEKRLIEISAAPLWNPDGSFGGIIESSRDITERERVQQQLQEEQARIQHLAHYDPLTNLPNRLLFQDRLHQSLIKAKPNNRLIALLFINLDRFKTINESLGYQTGDRLLQAVAERLRNGISKKNTVARLGGDEFAVILEETEHTNTISIVAHQIIMAMASPFKIDNHDLYLGVSIGISLYPTDGQDVETLTKNAGAAMYLAKKQGRGNYQFFTTEMTRKAMRQLMLDTRLRQALEREELQVFYQPQVNPKNGQIVGMEALVRWPGSQMGIISPAEFIPLAEESGLIVPLGEWVMWTACAQTKAWQEAGLPQLRVAVNLSAQQFRQKNLMNKINTVLSETRLTPACLELELTETILLEGTEKAITLMTEIKQLGIHLSIDDFGTGYSSLSYLKQFPINNLKVAQEFVRDITTDPNDAAIALAVMSLAKSLGLKVIAEGVETEEHLAFFQVHDCDLVQGYFFSRPLPAEEFIKLF